MQKPSLPKGTRDFGPEQMQKRRYLLSTIEKVYQLYGFVPIETPAMEQLSTLTGKYGEEGDKLLFRILNSGDFLKKAEQNDLNSFDQLMPKIAEKGLRYDLTVPFARFVVMHRNELSFPFRRYQMQPVWRADRPQKGRYREFWQCDADIIGTESLLSEADLLAIYRDVFQSLGIGVKLMVNHRKVLEGIAGLAGLADHFQAFTVAIDKLDKIGWEGVSPELLGMGLMEHQLADLQEQMKERIFEESTLAHLKTLLKDSSVAQQGLHELEHLLAYKKAGNNDFEVVLNLSLARGLDYYTGCIFEAVPTEMKMGSISGGGRYANLTEVFGLPNMSGVGISFGIDRIYDVLEELERWPAESAEGSKMLLCHFDEKGLIHCLQLASELRAGGLAVEVYPEIKKLGKQLDYANKKGISYALICGEEEMESGIYSLKDLEKGSQVKLNKEDLLSHLR